MSNKEESTRVCMPWTEIEEYALVRSRREHLEELASVMRRTVDEVEEKYNELSARIDKLMDKRINQYIKMGLDAKEAFVRTFSEFGIDFYRVIAKQMGADALIIKS